MFPQRQTIETLEILYVKCPMMHRRHARVTLRWLDWVNFALLPTYECMCRPVHYYSHTRYLFADPDLEP